MRRNTRPARNAEWVVLRDGAGLVHKLEIVRDRIISAREYIDKICHLHIDLGNSLY